MLKKLELDSLKADLSAVEYLLSSRSEEEDPIGWMQYSSRKQEIEEEINRIGSVDSERVGVGLFFGGRPVWGSQGIKASFASSALEQFQDLVSKKHASLETGLLASRGRVPLKQNAQLMITEVARGSFGFILEENLESDSPTETPLKEVVDEVSELIFRISSSDNDTFEKAIEALDDRLLKTLKQFFLLLDDGGATLKIVEGDKEFVLDHDAVRIARTRTEIMEIQEKEDEEMTGILYALPSTRKFELVISPNKTIKGSINKDCNEEITNVVGKRWTVKIKIREVREGSRANKYTYTLTQLVKEAN